MSIISNCISLRAHLLWNSKKQVNRPICSKMASLPTLRTESFVRTAWKRLVHLSFGFVLISQVVGATLTTPPANTIVVRGQTARIACSTNGEKDVYWMRTLIGSETEQYIYFKENGFNITNVDDRFSIDIDKSTGKYNLVITDAQPKDAGRYACTEESGRGERHSAEFVIANSMQCSPSTDTSVIVMAYNIFGIKQDSIQMTCDLNYTGNIEPSLEWSWPGSEEQPESTFVTRTLNSVTSTLILSAKRELNNAKFKCQATVAGGHLNQSDPSWESSPMTVTYAEFQETNVDQCPGVDWNLVCNPNCSYTFVEMDSIHCKCQYTYSLNYQVYNATSVTVACTNRETVSTRKVLTIIGIIAGSLGLLGLAVGIIYAVIRLIRRRRTKNLAGDLGTIFLPRFNA